MFKFFQLIAGAESVFSSKDFFGYLNPCFFVFEDNNSLIKVGMKNIFDLINMIREINQL